MSQPTSLHSLCRWTFNAGKGGFVPADIRPAWSADRFTTVDFIRLVRKQIAPRLPEHVELGVELHYDNEYDEDTAEAIADALAQAELPLAMVTPGAHLHFGYGGIASLDPEERRAAEAFVRRSVELAYGPLRKAWHADAEKAPSLVVWNGSFGYDLATVGIRTMYQHLKEGIARLCEVEADLGGQLYVTLEPKPNEGHPAMLLPTVASAIVLWHRVADEHGVSLEKKGVNKEIGHSEMVGLDVVHDTVEELDSGMMHHTHLNSQGLSGGIVLGGPGKFDIDHGVCISGINIAVAGLMQDAGYARWKGHDMQPRPYDDEAQATDRVVRSVLAWEACEAAARTLDTEALLEALAARQTAQAEDQMRAAVQHAHEQFDAWYEAACQAADPAA